MIKEDSQKRKRSLPNSNTLNDKEEIYVEHGNAKSRKIITGTTNNNDSTATGKTNKRRNSSAPTAAASHKAQSRPVDNTNSSSCSSSSSSATLHSVNGNANSNGNGNMSSTSTEIQHEQANIDANSNLLEEKKLLHQQWTESSHMLYQKMAGEENDTGKISNSSESENKDINFYSSEESSEEERQSKAK